MEKYKNKILVLGLILIMLVGLFSSTTLINTVEAAARGTWGNGCIVTGTNGQKTLEVMSQAQCNEPKGTWGNGCIVPGVSGGSPTLEVMSQAQCAGKGTWGNGCIVPGVTGGSPTLEVMSQAQCNQTKGTWGNGCIVRDANGLSRLEVMSQAECLGTVTAETTTNGTCSDPQWKTPSECGDHEEAWTVGYQLLAPLPCPSGDSACSLTTVDTSQGLGSYLNLMIKIFIGISAVLAVVMIVTGGLEVMTSELSHTKEAGKERIMQAILGLVIALGAYALLNTINPDLLKSDLNPPATQIQVSSTPQVTVGGSTETKPAAAPAILGTCNYKASGTSVTKITTQKECYENPNNIPDYTEADWTPNSS